MENEENESFDQEDAAQALLERAHDPQYVLNFLEHAAQLIRDGELEAARNLIKLLGAVFRIQDDD